MCTGPYKLTKYEVGVSARVERRDGWWGGEGYLDAIQWDDYGTDPTAMVNAFESEEVDCNFETQADSLDQMESIGMINSDISTGSTIVARMNVNNKPYDDQRVRNAIQLSVDNATVSRIW